MVFFRFSSIVYSFRSSIPCYRRFTSEAHNILANGYSVDKILGHPFLQDEKYCGEELSVKTLPSVTRILGATRPPESELALLAWKKRMIANLGEEEFEAYQKAILSAGTGCHAAIEEHLKGTPLDDVSISNESLDLWKSAMPVLKEVTSVLSTEAKCVHPHLKYYGYADCVADFRGEICTIDWKTSQKTRYNLNECYDDPLQVAAYAGAINCSLEPDKQIRKGLVVKIYHNGRPASTFLMNQFTLEFYWMKWLKRLVAYYTLNPVTVKK